jgi:hypothetical protein
MQYVDQAKLRSIEIGRPWTQKLELTYGKIKRAATRGLGAPQATVLFPVAFLHKFPDDPDPRVAGGPAWPKRSDVVGCWWACRQVEFASKTDQAALGARRSHRCSCGALPRSPRVTRPGMCPHCAIAAQFE